MDKKLFKSASSSAVRVKSTTDQSTIFEIVGVPYGGPSFLQGKDFHGEKFTKETNYGKNAQGTMVVDTIYAFYDHALNDLVGKDLLGYAKFIEDTDEGLIYEIEVDKAYRYRNMLLALAEKNLLGASSQPVQTAVDIDENTGIIKQWFPVEISLTPTPANPNAVAQVLKSFNMDYKMEDSVEEDMNKDTQETTDVETDLSKEIEQAFEDAPTQEEITVTEIKALVVALQTELASIKAENAKSAANVVALGVEIGKINTGLKTFALSVAKSLKSQVTDTLKALDKKSQVETEIEQELDGDTETDTNRRPPVKSVIPVNAPGMRSK